MIKQIIKALSSRIVAYSKEKKKMSRTIVKYSIVFISVYTAAVLYINVKYNIEPSTVLTTSVYGFFGLELVMLLVKRLKEEGFEEVDSSLKEKEEG